jgi:roadblock/LC7 domain-containing protein
MAKQLFFCLFLLLCYPALAICQIYNLKIKDFGCSYALLPSKNISLDLYSTPAKSNQPFARLDAGDFENKSRTHIPRSSITYLNTNSMENMSERIVEIFVCVYGLAVLSFSPDSEWVNVSLDCNKEVNPPSAWFNVFDASLLNVQIKSWTNFFEKNWTLHFLNNSDIMFYSKYADTTQIFPKLSMDKTRPDYCMRVIKTSGHWMLVYLDSPCNIPVQMDSLYQSKNQSPKVWIRHIDDRGRPRVWYLSE